MHFRRSTPDDFKLMAEFITAHNQLPTEHCLHCGQNFEEVYEELKDYNSRSEERFILALQKNQEESKQVDAQKENIIGLIGGDSNNDPLTEIWLWGPFVDKTVPSTLKQQLFDELLKTFPSIKKMTAFYHLENQTDKLFYEQQGFKEKQEATHDYRCKAESCPPNLLQPNPNIIPYEDEFLSQFKELHELAFPKTYYSIDEIMELKNLQNEKFKLWIQKDVSNQLLGYTFANITPNNEGYVHYLAVHPEHRKKGIGSQLLQKALYFFFIENNLPLTSLTVADKNNARRLYEKHGFQLMFSGRGAFWTKDENKN